MKRLIQVEIRAFTFSNTPILQYSNTPKHLAVSIGIAIELKNKKATLRWLIL